ncbi:MAG: hypothetical protein ACPHXR_00730 [Flavicella sp.]
MRVSEKSELLVMSIALKTHVDVLYRLLPILDVYETRKEVNSIMEVFLKSIQEYNSLKKDRISLIMASVALVSLDNVLFQSYDNKLIAKKCYESVALKLNEVKTLLQLILA